MGNILQDLRYAVRTFAATPALTTVLVLSLALGIGANTALYSAIDAIFLRGLPVRNPGELVVLGWTAGPSQNPFSPQSGGVFSRNSSENKIVTVSGSRFSRQLVDDFQAADTLANVAAFANVDTDATVDGYGDEITAQLVSGNYFETVGVTAAAGRTIIPSDDLASAEPAVVVSHGFWSRRFSPDPAAVGKRVLLNGVLTATIVGVLPADFHIGRGVVPDFSIPLVFEKQLAAGLLARENWGLSIVARMKSGYRAEQVEGNLQGIFQGAALQLAPNTSSADMPKLAVISASRGFSMDIVATAFGRGRSRFNLLAIIGGVFIILLLIVGLNVANLLVARAATRQYEIGVRLAMGAGRRRLVRQFLTESLVLASVGGTFGTLLAYIGKDFLRVFIRQDTRTIIDLRVDPSVLAFCAIASLLTGVLFGIAPALKATRMDVSAAVKQGGRAIRSGSRGSIGRALLVFQVAMAVVLLVGAGLLLRSVGNLPSDNVGFNANNMLVFRANVGTLNDDRGKYESVVDAIKSLPGVSAATTSSTALISTSGTFSGSARFAPPVEGLQPVIQSVRIHTVDRDFFAVLGIPLVRGRAFLRDDAVGSKRVAIITESLARHFGSEPIGWRLQPGLDERPYEVEIVGVVGNVGVSEIGNNIDGTVFLPGSQQQGFLPTFEVRTAGPPMQLLPAIRETLRRIEPNLRASQVATEKELVDRALSQTRYIAAAWALFSGIALLLTSIGLYGLLSYAVARRINEIGIRMALGARGPQVLRSVLSQILILVSIGLVLGLGLSQLVSFAIRPFVYGVPPHDPRTLSLSIAVLLAVAVVAGYLPARRATLVDPTVALRHE
jgi:predicted permease